MSNYRIELQCILSDGRFCKRVKIFDHVPSPIECDVASYEFAESCAESSGKYVFAREWKGI